MLPPLLEDEVFFLVFGDVLFDIDLARMMEFHREKKAKATLFVHPNSHPFDSDLVVCDDAGKVQRFDPKHDTRTGWYHNCVNAGAYVLAKAICEKVPIATKMDLEKELLAGMIRAGETVYAYRSSEYIKDVGTVERITAAEKELKSGYITKRSLRERQRAIFLDRDGTVNRKNGLIYREEQFELEDGVIEAIHAGLECGLFIEKMPGLDAVSVGPEMHDVHSVQEKLSVPSTAMVYRMMRELLKRSR